MIVLPVIERELRAAARHALTYNLRVLAGLALLVVLGMFWLRDNGGPGAGARLFGDFHRTLFFAIWILVPLLTADCISRERREGTLPLLFLTPLSAWDIVSAKGLAQGVRSFTLWLAVLPIFTICFLGGGVDWSEAVMSALVNFSAVCLALGAGLLASARARIWTRTLAWAACLAFLLLTAFLALLPSLVLTYWALFFPQASPRWTDFAQSPAEGLAMATDIQWARQSGLFRGGTGALLCTYIVMGSFSAAALYLLSRFSAWNLKRTWQENPASARVVWLQNKLLRPVLFKKQLRAWLRWELRHNPIGWLERRSWSGRLVVWSWFAIVICIYSSLFGHFGLYQRAFHALQCLLATLLAGSMALSAAGSFRRERETGVLELLLVAPLNEWQIVAGRMRGLWSQFLPAIILLCSVWLYGATFLSSANEVPSVLAYVVTFVTVPVVGLYFSLVKPNFIAALVWTMLVQVVVPAAAVLVIHLDPSEDAGLGDFITQAFIELAVAVFLGWRLLVVLKRREFVRNLA